MISIKDMDSNLKINVSAVQKHVEKLKLKGLLKRVWFVSTKADIRKL